MDTIYNVGDAVYHEVIVDEINIDKTGIMYKIKFKSYFDNTVEACIRVNTIHKKEDVLNAET